MQVTPSKLTISKEVAGIDEAAALDADYSFTVKFEDGNSILHLKAQSGTMERITSH